MVDDNEAAGRRSIRDRAMSDPVGDAVIETIKRERTALLSLEEADLAAQWNWRWEETRSLEWNVYSFSDHLEKHKRRCRQWEEHHHGGCCVVERVRDKYVFPRVREFLAEVRRVRSAERARP